MDEKMDQAQLMKLAQSPAGKKLMAMLKSQGGAQLQGAMAKAAQGDYAQAKETLTQLLNSPEAKKLLEELGHG